MPIQRCRLKGKPGFKWGNDGKCYTYTPGDKAGLERAKNKAAKQGQAVEASKRTN